MSINICVAEFDGKYYNKRKNFEVKTMWIYKSNLTIQNKKYIEQIEKEYNEYRELPVNELSFSSFMRFMRDGDRLEYEGQYFLRRRMLRCFAL